MRLRGLGLPDAGVTLEEHGLLERERQVERRREPAVGEEVGLPERGLELVDRPVRHARSVPRRPPAAV